MEFLKEKQFPSSITGNPGNDAQFVNSAIRSHVLVQNVGNGHTLQWTVSLLALKSSLVCSLQRDQKGTRFPLRKRNIMLQVQIRCGVVNVVCLISPMSHVNTQMYQNPFGVHHVVVGKMIM